MALIARHVTVKGRVQSVWYRGWTVEAATRLGLSGWVRNLRNGDVEAVIEGEEGAVELMLAQMWDGPPAAQVTAVEVRDAVPCGCSGFEQRATA